MSGAFLTEDLSVVFSASDFAVTATYTPVGGSASSVMGIFDDEDIEVDTGEGVILQHSARFTCASDDVTGVSEDDTIVIGGKNYRVAYTKDNGTGVVELILEAV